MALSVGLLCLALIGTSVGGAIWITKRDAVERIGHESAELAGTMASSLDGTMFERYREIQIVAGLGPLRGVWNSNPAEIRTVLNTLQASLPTYAWIGFATPDGTVRAATKSMLEGASVAERPWFKAALDGPAVSDVHEALLLSKVIDASPAPYAEPFRFVDVSMPVYDTSHALTGVLGAHLSWTWVDEVRKRLIAQTTSGETTDVWILSKEGRVLLGPRFGEMPFDPERIARMQAAKHGVFEDQTGSGNVLTGFAVTSGFQAYPGLGWIVVARRLTSVAYASVDRTIRVVLILSSATALLGVYFAWVLARRTAAPIRRLTAAAHQIGRDPTTRMLPWLGGAREFVELSSSLRSLLRRLGVAEQELSHAEERSNDSSRHFQQAIDMLRMEADHDALTGLFTRRAFLAFAEDAVPYFKRYGRSVAVLMVDIDHFKQINDSHGHVAGDAVLRHVADILALSVRGTDKVSRFGGEEFVILLREIGEYDLVALAERMRASVASIAARHEDITIPMTISIGAAVVSNSDDDIQALIQRADQALYAAKRAGRDCVKLDVAPSSAILDQAA